MCNQTGKGEGTLRKKKQAKSEGMLRRLVCGNPYHHGGEKMVFPEKLKKEKERLNIFGDHGGGESHEERKRILMRKKHGRG